MTHISSLPDCPIAPLPSVSNPQLHPEPGRRDPTPNPTGHGGRRPGSGAPKGNINALRNGDSSARYALTSLLIRAMSPYWRESLNPPNTRAERRRQVHRLLEAALWTIRSYPEMPEQLEENMRAYIGPGVGGYRIPMERDILNWLGDRRLPTRHRYRRDFQVLAYLFEHQPDLAAILVEDFILDRFNAGLTATAPKHPPQSPKNSIEQPNNQERA
jgi:hypothetical protein